MSTTVVREIAGVPISVDTETGRFSATIPGAGKWGRDVRVERATLRDVVREVEKTRAWAGVEAVVVATGPTQQLTPKRVLRAESSGRYRTVWTWADGERSYYQPCLHDDEIVTAVNGLAIKIAALIDERDALLRQLTRLTPEALSELRMTALAAGDGNVA